jgi:hypothetical protein
VLIEKKVETPVETPRVMTVHEQAKEILRRALHKISPKGRWNKNMLAKDADGIGVFWASERARSWCALGAVFSEGKDFDPRATKEAQRLLERSLPRGNEVQTFNDSTNKHGVLALFRRAIAR